MTWHIAEKFNTSNVAEFTSLLGADRLAHIGYCLPTGRTGDFATITEAYDWIASGRNVYADVKQA